MDPPAMMNNGSYNLAEIWQFPVNANGRGQFGQSLSGQFGDSNGDILRNDPMNLEQRGTRGGGGGRKRRDVAEDDSAKVLSSSNVNGNGNGNGNRVNDSDAKRLKTSGNRDENHDSKTEAEPSSGKPVEQNTQPPEPPKQDYIHVRARRGQATDSHSLAERVIFSQATREYSRGASPEWLHMQVGSGFERT
ncbi:transcription factor BHLH089-like [Jatropha curcas]|uniref:transcription factor BHLH089-like n=1 Tax=Jatropha curcas TaxID=180498 RepID=UPI0018962314|nr:transcription factor BHLH089-like [Jatropha curcas]